MRAGVVGEVPTRLDAIQRSAGIVERHDISRFADTGLAPPAAMKKVLGAVAFEERVIFVDESQVANRVRFTDAHEAMHALCPWHQATLLTDTKDTLFAETNEQLEQEANYGAAHLLFQGTALHRLSAGQSPSLASPIALAEVFGASLHAAIRYFAEEHPGCVGLLVGGVMRRAGTGNVPLFYGVESAEYRSRFGPAVRLQPAGELVFAECASGLFADILDAAAGTSGPVSGWIQAPDLGGTSQQLRAEAFHNQRNYFVLVAAA